MSASSSEQNLSQKQLAQLLFDNNMLKSGNNNINDLISNPEFQVLRLLTNFGELGDSEIESKYQAPYSLSMILSNLSADNLIEQTGNYKWKISNKLESLINNYIQNTKKKIETAKIKIADKQKSSFQQSKKADFKKMADALENSSYVPNYYASVEELYKIAEIELLVIINNKQPVSTNDLEKRYTNQNSLSLTISNLKADNLIQEDHKYNWILEEKFNKKLSTIHDISINLGEETRTDIGEENEGVPNLAQKINFIEHSQFIKILIDMNYFKGQSLNQFIESVDFRVLNYIYSNGPVSQEELEADLLEIPSFSMVLSNLKIDGLIMQNNDYRWKLDDVFRRNMMKIKVNNEEFLEEIKLLEKLNKPKPVVIEKEINIEPEIIEEEIIEKEENESYLPDEMFKPSSPTDIIKDMLIKYKYIKTKINSIDNLMEIPEFEILKIIAENNSITTEELEIKANASSVSLTLSNLSADGLIEQTLDYKWKVSEELQKKLVPSSVKSSQEIEQEKIEKVRILEEEQLESTEKEENNNIHKLAIACRKKGYISNENTKFEELKTYPEFEVLYIVQKKAPISADDIKNEAKSVSPVLISRTVSKLEADNCITTSVSFKYILSETFIELLIEDELKERKEMEQNEARKLEAEKIAKLKQIESHLKVLASILINEGYITSTSMEAKHLMGIPEFEIIAILNKEGAISIDDLKMKAESVSPVLISRTISKLEADNLIIRTISGTFDLTDTLKAKIQSETMIS